MKQNPLINHGLRCLVLLVLTLLMPSGAWAYSYELALMGCGAGPNNEDPYVWGYVNGDESGQVEWSCSRLDVTSYTNGLGITLSSSKSLTIRSRQTFTGKLSQVALRLKKSSDAKNMSITTKAIDEQGVSTELSHAHGYLQGDYLVTLNPTVTLNNQYLELTLTSNESSEWSISEWTLIGMDIEELVEYGLAVGGERVTNFNASDILGDKTMSYDAETSTLTINGYNGSDNIWTDMEQLTINVAATSSVGPIYWSGQAETGGTLTFARDEAVGDVELTIESASGAPAVSGFSEVSYTNMEPATPLGYSVTEIPKVIITPQAYPLWIGDYLPPTKLTAATWITLIDENQESVGTASFDPSTYRLTLNNFSYESSRDGLVAQIRNFGVNLIGYNSISVVEGEQPAMRVGSTETNTLTFYTDGENPGTLTLQSQVAPISGTGLTVSCQNGLVRTDNVWDGTYYTEIRTLMAPQMFLNTNEAGTYLLGFECESGDGLETRYSIDYADDELQDVTDALYTPDYSTGTGNPEILGPCTVTAYTKCGDVQTATIKGKLFGLANYYPSIVYGKAETMPAPELLPAIEDGDGITVSYSAEKAPAEGAYDEIAKINSETGEITIVGPGTVPFIVSFDTEDESNCQVLNYYLSSWTLNFYLTVSAGYNLFVNGEQVTEVNRKHILGEGNESVQFDGGHTLILNNATLNTVQTALNGTEQLTIFLKGDNTIGNNEVAHAIWDGNQGTGSLVIETAPNNPGKLTLKATSAIVSNYRSVDLKQPLTIVSSTPEGATSLIGTTTAIKEAHIAPPMELIIDDVASTSQGTSTDISYSNLTGVNADVATKDLNNRVINNLLYTLNDMQTGGVNDDGYDDRRGMVVINSTMTDDQVRTIHDLVQCCILIPGSTQYAEAYKGLTFRVPGGTGKIMLNVQVERGFEFHVKIGSQEPVRVKSSGSVTLNYTACEATYVYVYLVNPNGHSGAPALANDSRRIGPKSTVSGGLGGMNVSSNNITSVPDVSADYMMLSASAMAPIFGNVARGGHITLSQADFGDITDLEPGLFSPKPTAASAPMLEMEPGDVHRAPAANVYMPDGITYIDLRQTSIVGMEVSRSAGAFKDVPDNTFIYMPAGNSVAAGTKNVVIGGICDDVELNAAADAPFELAGNVTAAKATLSVGIADGTNSAAVCLPYELKNPDDYGKFYKLNRLYAGNTALNMTREKGTVKANTPYIFDAKAEAKVAGKVLLSQANVTLSEAAQLGEGLVGVYDAKVGYGYQPGTKRSDGKFVQTTVHPFGAYVPAGSGDKLTITWGGDVNSSGDISITDAVGVVNKILGTPAGGFDEEAADVNGDDAITITDAVGVVNIILGQ